jgi:hypothetical protein
VSTPIPAQGAGRIRWEDEPGGYAVTEDGFIGPAELNWRAFRIWRPDLRVDPRPFLTSDLHGQARRQVHGTLDELKAAAERWLQEFVTSLGAVFPDRLREAVTAERDRRSKAALAVDPEWAAERHFGWADALDWVLALTDRAGTAPPSAGGGE